MNESYTTDLNSAMVILRQRIFISHNNKSQRHVTDEYTIMSKHENLTNLIFVSKDLHPNLLVLDDKNNTLPIMSTNAVKQLLELFLKKSKGDKKEKLESMLSQIKNGKLYLIWIKIPNPLMKHEVRTVTLNYSPRSTGNKSSHFMIQVIERRPYPLYYSLFAPNEFDFKQTKFVQIEKEKNQTSANYSPPENVEQIKTHNSTIVRVNSDSKGDFTIKYSFKPSSEVTLSTKFGVGVLSALFAIVFVLRSLDVSQNILIENQTQIGLFIIGGSLLLPQLTSNHFIRRTQTLYYLAPAALGVILVVWQWF